jgi:hypothetical protein
MVLCWEEYTLTQILTAPGLEAQWRVLEHVAAYGARDREAIERHLRRVIELKQPARWGRYYPVAVDDTKVHRASKPVWGICMFHEASARSANRMDARRSHPVGVKTRPKGRRPVWGPRIAAPRYHLY